MPRRSPTSTRTSSGEGSFTGKGIYDIDAFDAAMDDRVPENALLSHDLFEGVFARAGLVTDIELFDEFPSNYLVSRHASTAGRAATGSCCPGSSACADSTGRLTGPHDWSRPLEDGRQPAPLPVAPSAGHAVADWTSPCPGRPVDAFVLAR